MKQLTLILTILLSVAFGRHVLAQNTRPYYTNRIIGGPSEDAQGTNYILLHKVYNGAMLNDSYVQGEITASRGSAGAWNRKWSVKLNTGTAYNTNRGNIFSFNEYASLVTLTYNSEPYLAVQILSNSSLSNFLFTGWAQNESLILVFDQAVSNVQPFTSFDVTTIGGPVAIGTNYVGTSKLAVEGTISTRKIKVTQGTWADNVFNKSYELPSLAVLEKYIEDNHHLPDVPTEAEVKANGQDLGEMNKILLQKVEELTLYLIELEKKNAEMNQQQSILIKRIENLEACNHGQ